VISNRFITMVIRGSMILFWVLVIISLLYIPRLGRFFRSRRSLSIFTWSSLIDPTYLKRFEKETGIKLYVSFYESNEELMSKLKATQGKGYDLIIPSDYLLVKLIKKGFLKKIEKQKLNFLDTIDPKLLNLNVDPRNEYSIPYFWAVYGVGVDTEYYGGKTPEATWGLIFNPKMMPPTVGMTDTIREAIYIPAQYLFGNIEALNDPENVEKVKELLIQQKKHVEVYSEVRAEDMLLAKSCPAVLGLSNDIWRAKRENPDIEFLIPKEGSFLSIDSVVIPKSTDKDDLIYQFINFLYQNDVFKHHVEKYGLCPTLKTIEAEGGEQFCPTGATFKQLHFFKDILPKKKLNEIWLAVMAS